MQAAIKIVMGSQSDWKTMQKCCDVLDELKIAYDVEIVSAHRTPDKLFTVAETAEQNGFKLIIAGAGGAAHLPGMLASKTHLPVLGVPIKSKALNGIDSLLSIVQMPKGIPVATFAIGEAGAANAGLFAASMLANDNDDIKNALQHYRKNQTDTVLKNSDPRD